MNEVRPLRKIAVHWPLITVASLWVLLLDARLQSELVRAAVALLGIGMMVYSGGATAARVGAGDSFTGLGLNVIRFYT